MTSRKKIALIVPGGFGTGKNNLGIPVLEQIVELLANQQLEVTVFQLYKVNEGYEAKGFQLLDFKANNKIAQYLNFLIEFYRNHKKNNFEAVHGFWTWPCGFLAVLLGKVFKIKSIVSVLGGDAASLPEFNYGHLRKFFNRKMILWSLENCDHGTALTNYLAKNLYRAGLKTDLKIIPWGVDQHIFNFQPKSAQDPLQFLHIANLNPVKDQRTLLLAFEIIHQALPSHLTIIGEGTEGKNIRSLIERLHLQDAITLSGHWPYEDLPDFYHKSDVLLHTSRSEGQCEVVTEAISCGTLVAGTKVGLVHDFPEFFVCVNIGDYESLAKNVISLLKDQGRMDHLRRSAHHWAKEHSVQWTVSQIIKLY